ncbi:MAG TPA: DOMON-like domain-containing protein [Steroidobacteraceae bacterium]|jgi:hypothetical protein|nr:DOMON-like domain-containing protein [Steroidobacteraceae bacterium]
MPASPIPSALLCHAACACEAARSLNVAVSVLGGGRLQLLYALDADPARLRIPAERAAQRGDELWRHTCFEAFLRVTGTAGYCELNFAPSRAWAMYRFSARREGMAVITDARAPEIAVQRRPAGLTLAATVVWRDLIRGAPPLSVRMAAAAVLEDEGGSLSYWALRHPPGKPDFHHPDSFTLELAL